jgi:thioredoxin 1
MAPIIDNIEEQYADRALVMRIDVDKSKDVGRAYQVSGVPVFILFKDGKEIWKHNGVIAEDELKKQIESSL